jgi:large subunit ribosomal protein L3
MEMGLDGGDFSEQLQFAKEKLGEEYSFTDSFQEGGLTDIVAVTKGYGWQGVIKRFGGKLLSHKNSKKRRQHGNMGAFGDGYVRKSIRQGGQTGYHQRTEYNKRILRVANPEEHSITPSGGFLHYGEVKSDYILVHGSVPGPAKRLIRFRDATRGSDKVLPDYEITYVSTASKQGV